MPPFCQTESTVSPLFYIPVAARAQAFPPIRAKEGGGHRCPPPRGREEKRRIIYSIGVRRAVRWGRGVCQKPLARSFASRCPARSDSAGGSVVHCARKECRQPLYLWVYRNRQIWTVRERNVNDRGQDGGVFAAGARRDAKISKVAPTAFSRGIPQRVLFKQPLPPVFPAGHPPHPQKIAPPAREGALRKSSLIPRPSRPRARSRARRRCRSRSSPWPRSLRWRR